MKRALFALAAGVFVYGGSRLILGVGRPDEPVPEPAAASEGEGRAPASAPAELDAERDAPGRAPATPPAEEAPLEAAPVGTAARLRSLKIAEVPAPGEEGVAAAAAAMAPVAGGGSVMGPAVQQSGTAPVFVVAQPPAPGRPGARAPQPAPRRARVTPSSDPDRAAVAPAPAPRERSAPSTDSAPAAPPPAPDVGADAWRQTQVLLNDAKKLELGAPKAGEPPRLNLASDPVARQIMQESRAIPAVRAKLAQLRSSGRPVEPEEEEEAVASVMRSHGMPVDPGEPARLAALADDPPPEVSDQAMTEAYEDANRHLPSSSMLVRIIEESEREAPEERASRERLPPPPRGALEVYRRTRDTLLKAERELGVRPEHAIAETYVETRWGANTGRHNVNALLHAQIARYPPGSAKYRQAVRDRAALIRLSARGELGGFTAATVRGSHGAAIGAWQCLPSSCEAYGRSPNGGPRNPFELNTAMYSAANYLARHGYRRNVARSIFAYNHSQEYVRTVLSTAERIRQVLPRERE